MSFVAHQLRAKTVIITFPSPAFVSGIFFSHEIRPVPGSISRLETRARLVLKTGLSFAADRRFFFDNAIKHLAESLKRSGTALRTGNSVYGRALRVRVRRTHSRLSTTRGWWRRKTSNCRVFVLLRCSKHREDEENVRTTESCAKCNVCYCTLYAVMSKSRDYRTGLSSFLLSRFQRYVRINNTRTFPKLVRDEKKAFE